MAKITIDARDWFRGVSTTNELADGGFSPLSKGINLFASPGLLLPGPAPTDFSGTPDISKGLFAFAPTSSNSSVGHGLGANNNDDGKFTLLDPTGAIVVTSDTGRNYVPIQSDMVRYGNEYFYTSQQTAGKSSLTFGANDFNWWTGTLGLIAFGVASIHKTTEYDGILYFSDGRYVHSWDGSAATYNALELPAGYEISDFVTYNNLLFIAASQTAIGDIADASNCRIFTWDGLSASFLDEILIQDSITAFLPFGGTLFVTTKKFFGYFTGSTVSPLYPLTTPVYKYQAAITQDRLYMLQGTDVLCYGNPVISRPKFFSFPLKHASSLIGITSFQTGKLIYAYASKVGSFTDVNGSDQAGGIFYANRIPFDGQAKIRSITLEHEALASGSSQTIEYIDDIQTTRAVGTLSFAAFGAVTKHRFDVLSKPATLTAQLKITFGVVPNKGIRRIHIVYDPSEIKENK